MSTKHTVTTPMNIQVWDGGEHEMEARITYRFLPGDPGRLSGPPENCYPPEPAEADVERVELRFSQHTPWFDAPPWLETMLADDEQLYEFLVSCATESIENARAEAAEMHRDEGPDEQQEWHDYDPDC